MNNTDQNKRKPGDYRRTPQATRETAPDKRKPGDYRRVDNDRTASKKTTRMIGESLSSDDTRNARRNRTSQIQREKRRSLAEEIQAEERQKEREALRSERAYEAALARQRKRQQQRESEAERQAASRTRKRRSEMSAEEKRRSINREKRRRERTEKQSAEMQPPKKKRKKMGKVKKSIILIIILLVIALAAICFGMIYFNLNKDLKDASVLDRYGISQEAADFALDHRIVNLAVFGVDAREDVEGSRSDCIMIASADYEHDSLKVTSLMRDTLIYCDPEEAFNKLNAAYSLGEEMGALRTINQNFDTAITDYVTIDFTSMVTLVNAVGGVTVNIESEEELDWINLYLGDVNAKVHSEAPDVPGTGEQLLDGSQALAYSRIRYVGNGDFDRTQRQRNVFEQVVRKAMDLSIFKKIALIKSVLPYVKTSLTNEQIMKYGANLLLMSSRELQQASLPDVEYLYEGFYNGMSVLYPYTLTDNIKKLYHFIYEADYSPSSTAQQINDQIQNFFW